MELSTVTGVSDIIKRLHTVKGETAQGMERGLVRAGLFLQRQSQKVVPVDTGALKNSAFTRKEGSGFSTRVTVGYTMWYAVYVHEMTWLRHKPGKIAKFLEWPAREYRGIMIQLIREEASRPLKGSHK